MTPTGALDGIRVIEVGTLISGPFAGRLLADMGADVIKVEKPDGGDDARIWGPPFGPDGVTSLYFHSQNRNKRSVVLDLKLAADVEALHRLQQQVRASGDPTLLRLVLENLLPYLTTSSEVGVAHGAQPAGRDIADLVDTRQDTLDETVHLLPRRRDHVPVAAAVVVGEARRRSD